MPQRALQPRLNTLVIAPIAQWMPAQGQGCVHHAIPGVLARSGKTQRQTERRFHLGTGQDLNVPGKAHNRGILQFSRRGNGQRDEAGEVTRRIAGIKGDPLGRLRPHAAQEETAEGARELRQGRVVGLPVQGDTMT